MNWKHDPWVPVTYLKQINAPFGSFNCPRRENATSTSRHPALPCTIFTDTCGEQVYCRYGLIPCICECVVNIGNVQPDIVLVTVNVWNCTSPAECTGRHGTKTEGSHDERGPLAETERARERERERERRCVCLNKDTAQGLA